MFFIVFTNKTIYLHKNYVEYGKGKNAQVSSGRRIDIGN